MVKQQLEFFSVITYQKKKRDSMDTHYSTFTAPQRERWTSIFGWQYLQIRWCSYDPQGINQSFIFLPLKYLPSTMFSYRLLNACMWNIIPLTEMHPNSVERGGKKKEKTKRHSSRKDHWYQKNPVRKFEVSKEIQFFSFLKSTFPKALFHKAGIWDKD